MIAPAVADLAREFAGRAIVGKLNVDENPRTAGRFGVMSIPTLLIFQDGKVVDQIVGAQPAGVLRQRLARHVR
jgi:thioredoxin 1